MFEEDEAPIEVDYEKMIMGELQEKIELEIENYKAMPVGKERNTFRKFVSKLVDIYNRRAKAKLYKEMWWIN